MKDKTSRWTEFRCFLRYLYSSLPLFVLFIYLLNLFNSFLNIFSLTLSFHSSISLNSSIHHLFSTLSFLNPSINPSIPLIHHLFPSSFYPLSIPFTSSSFSLPFFNILFISFPLSFFLFPFINLLYLLNTFKGLLKSPIEKGGTFAKELPPGSKPWAHS